jgi:hypothetical protein
LEKEPQTGQHAMVLHLARVVGIETADMLVHEANA